MSRSFRKWQLGEGTKMVLAATSLVALTIIACGSLELSRVIYGHDKVGWAINILAGLFIFVATSWYKLHKKKLAAINS